MPRNSESNASCGASPPTRVTSSARAPASPPSAGPWPPLGAGVPAGIPAGVRDAGARTAGRTGSQKLRMDRLPPCLLGHFFWRETGKQLVSWRLIWNDHLQPQWSVPNYIIGWDVVKHNTFKRSLEIRRKKMHFAAYGYLGIVKEGNHWHFLDSIVTHERCREASATTGDSSNYGCPDFKIFYLSIYSDLVLSYHV